MKIRKVKKDPDDTCLAIPSAILPGLRVCSSIEPWVIKYLSNCRNLIIFIYQIILVIKMMARGNISRYGKKYKELSNRCSEVSSIEWIYVQRLSKV